MTPSVPTSRAAAAAFIFGLSALGCGFLTLVSGSDIFLLGVVAFSGLAVLLGIIGRHSVTRHSGQLQGGALAGWGIGLPVGGLCAGFLLLPAV